VKRDTAELRQSFDGKDPFMTGGHQIMKVRKKEKIVPKWINDQVKIRQILLESFPKLATDSVQRTRAARWARVIQLYYKMDYTDGQIVDELNDENPDSTVTLYQIRSIIRSIKRVAIGRSANGTGQRGRKPGRPKKRA
jgi:hypothetical protein